MIVEVTISQPCSLGMLSKSKGQLLRVTGCFHCLFLVDEVHTAAENPGEFQVPSVVADDAVKTAINFIKICMNHTLYLCGRSTVSEKVDIVLGDVAQSAEHSIKDDSVNAASNPGGYMLLTPVKRLHLTALNERKKIQGHGKQEGGCGSHNCP